MRLFLPLLSVVLLVSACSKKSEDPAPTTPAPTEPPAHVFTLNGAQGVRMTVDGTAQTTLATGDHFSYYTTEGLQNNPPTPSTRSYSAIIHNSPNDIDVFTLRLGTLSYTGAVDQEMFEAFFATGTREYGPVNNANIQRVQLEYRDSAGVLWSTSYGSGVQEGSTFNITEVQTGLEEQVLWAKVIANFNCTLYNTSGASKTVTDGALMLEMRDY